MGTVLAGAFRAVSARAVLVGLLVVVNLVLLGGNVLVWGARWKWVEAVAAGKLERSVGRARSMKVHVWSTSWLDLAAGRVRLLRLDARRLLLKNGLRLSRLSLIVEGVKAGPEAVTELKSVRWFVRLKESDLNRFLRLRGGLLHPVPVVRLQAGSMEVTMRQMFVKLPVRVTGGLRVEGGTRIHFEVPAGWDVRSLVVSGALSYLNPVVDLREAKIARLGVSVARLQIVEGALEVEGTASPPLPFEVPRQPEPEVTPEPDEDDGDDAEFGGRLPLHVALLPCRGDEGGMRRE